MKQRLSLKERGLALLAQREHSRVELRRKLLAHARAGQAGTVRWARAQGAAACCFTSEAEEAWAMVPPVPVQDRARPNVSKSEEEAVADAEAGADAQGAQVEAVLDWLQAHRYLCEERFVESRLQARMARFGNLRIHQELARHGLELSAGSGEALKGSEFNRAKAVWERKFGGKLPADLSDRNRQMRFLAGRGFSGDVIRRVLQGDGKPPGRPEFS